MGSLRLLAWLFLALTLIVLDSKGGWLSQLRQQASVLAQPLWQLAGLPSRFGQKMRQDAVSRGQLLRDNEELRNTLLTTNAQLLRLQATANENARLRALLGMVQSGDMQVQLAPILNIDLDPTRQRLLLAAGSRSGVRGGQTVIDAGGVLGQVIAVQPHTATVLLLTDPSHAIPVEVVRNGVRLVAYGQGEHLVLGNIPRTADVQVGDRVQTSGLGGRFPAGFPVGTVTQLRLDDSRALLVGDLAPAAALDRGQEVLLLREVRAAPGATQAATAPAGTTDADAPPPASTAPAAPATPATPSSPSPTPAPPVPPATTPAATTPPAPSPASTPAIPRADDAASATPAPIPAPEPRP